MGRGSGLLCALLFGAAFAACGDSGATKRPTPPATPMPNPSAAIEIARGQPLKIGISAPLSGASMDLGSDIADAVVLATRDRGDTFKGHPLVVERKDDGCNDAEKAAAVARALAADPAVVGVVGPMCTTGAQAADSVYEMWHIVHILPSATRADLSRQDEQYFFRVAWLDEAQSDAQAAYAHDTLRATTAIVIDDAEPYGRTLADAFTAAFEAAGGDVTSRERVERGDTDFAAVARRVKSANPDVVTFEGLNPEGALMVQALRKEGYSGAFIAPDGVLNARDFIDAAPDKAPGVSAAEGAIVTGGWTPGDDFVARFEDAFQRAPSTPFVLQAHDAATAMLKAIEAVATERADGTLVIDRAKLAESLRTQGLNGLTGTIRFDEHGDRIGVSPNAAGLAIYRVANGRFEAVP
jgi:branched-chain amino acid transport system substrate-binding protein